jgi:dTDP-3-amino-3,4,6-trideoxy-alpha-D-glucose transaminase
VPARDPAPATPIPLVRLDGAAPNLLAELMSAVESVAARSAFTLGNEVGAFEREFAAYCGTRSAIGVSSGTEAITSALRALEIGAGDEVALPTNYVFALAEAMTLAGAIPVSSTSTRTPAYSPHRFWRTALARGRAA